MPKDFKGRTAKTLYAYYVKNRDLKKFIQVSRLLLSEKGTNPLIRGEVCEVVLEVILSEFISRNNLRSQGWFLIRGLILGDAVNKTSDYLTELDLTLFTPRMIYVFECKSYRGEKILKDKGSLYVKEKNKEVFKLDVFDQNKKHSMALLKHVIPHLLNRGTSNKLIKMVMFDFSVGEYDDQREPTYKKIFPLMDDKTVLGLFKTYKSKEDCWDVKGLETLMNSLSENKTEKTKQHLTYVKSIKR